MQIIINGSKHNVDIKNITNFLSKFCESGILSGEATQNKSAGSKDSFIFTGIDIDTFTLFVEDYYNHIKEGVLEIQTNAKYAEDL